MFLAFAVRHPAVRRAHRAAGARRARPRGRGGRGVARRQPVHDRSGGSSCPSLVPAIAAGAALSFARAISEYGSLVLLSGNLPMQTEVTSVRILSYIENGNLAVGGGGRDGPAGRRARRHRRPRRHPATGGPPWLTPPLGDRRRRARRSPASRRLPAPQLAGDVRVPRHRRRLPRSASWRGRSARRASTPSPTASTSLRPRSTTRRRSRAAAHGVGRGRGRSIINTSSASASRCCWCATDFPGKRAAQRPDRPAAVGLARSSSASSLVLVYGGRDGWFGPTLEDARLPGHLRHPGHRPGHRVRVAAAGDPRGRAGARGDRHRPGAGRPAASAPTPSRRSGGSPCRRSSGPSSTASC